MARQQQNPNQGQSTAEQNAGNLPSLDQQSTGGVSPSSPIGVPFYETDPRTGLPVGITIGPDGKPVGTPKRWTATTTGAQNLMGMSGQLVHGGSYQVQQQPRYFDGAQWLPGSLPPDKIAGIQKMMVWAGLGKSTDFQLGIWDSNSMKAYSQLLAQANAAGTDAPTALKTMVLQRKEHPPDVSSLPVQLTNPDDLKTAFRSAFVDLLGQGPDDGKLNQLVDAYHQIEASSQHAQQTAQATGAGPDITQAPSPQNYAEAQIRKENPAGIQQHELVGQGGLMDTFASTLAKWGPL